MYFNQSLQKEKLYALYYRTSRLYLRSKDTEFYAYRMLL